MPLLGFFLLSRSAFPRFFMPGKNQPAGVLSRLSQRVSPTRIQDRIQRISSFYPIVLHLINTYAETNKCQLPTTLRVSPPGTPPASPPPPTLPNGHGSQWTRSRGRRQEEIRYPTRIKNKQFSAPAPLCLCDSLLKRPQHLVCDSSNAIVLGAPFQRPL